MLSTSVSLLERLREPGEQQAWNQFVRLYTPLLWSWARRAGLQESDAADLVQEVLVVLVRKLPEFQLQPQGSFRSWLRTVALNKWRDRAKRVRPDAAGSALNEIADPHDSSEFEEAEYRRRLLRQELRLLQEKLQPATWRAFVEHGLRGRPAADVARELNLTPGAVYAAKFRVLGRLRTELAGLLDE